MAGKPIVVAVNKVRLHYLGHLFRFVALFKRCCIPQDLTYFYVRANFVCSSHGGTHCCGKEQQQQKQQQSPLPPRPHRNTNTIDLN